MFGHLDDPRPPEPSAEARVAVAMRAARHRRRRLAATTALVVVVVGALVVAVLGRVTTANARETVYQFDRTVVVPTDSPVPATALEDVVFVSPSHGFALADHRGRLVLAASTDGGTTWSVVTDNLPYATLGGGQVQMEFIDTQHGYLWNAAGGSGAGPLWWTNDGGATWDRAHIDGPVVDASAIGANVWALVGGCAPHSGCPPEIEISTDYGATWQVSPTPIPASTSFELARITLDRAYVLSYGPTTTGAVPNPNPPIVLTYTPDGGTTWVTSSIPCSSSEGAELAASSTLDLWLVCGGEPGAGQQGKVIYRSADGGRTWTLAARSKDPGGRGTPVGSLPTEGYVAPVAIGHKTLDVATPHLAWLQPVRGPVLVTRDGGVSWAPVPGLAHAGFGTGSPGNLTFISDKQGFACELFVGLWHTDDGVHWAPLDA